VLGRRSGSTRRQAWRDALVVTLSTIAVGAWFLVEPTEAASRIVTGATFAMTYFAIALGRLPGFRVDRAGAALAGASLMLASGALTIDEVARVIDFNTVALLLGMMIVVANLRLSGFFRLVNAWIVARARRPLSLLAAVTLASGLLSAFLLNDAICLVMTPLVIEVARRLRRDPVPYLLAVAMASNVGSAATITGNPQNILIGSFSHIPYGTFAARLSPVAAAGLVLSVLLIAMSHPAEFRRSERLEARASPPISTRRLPPSRC
jgi:Na+/H+ antiporter NhaD/arsenite permease-like protein